MAGVLAAAGAGLLVGALAWTWPVELGVVLTGAERLEVLGLLLPRVVAGGLATGFLARLARSGVSETSRWESVFIGVVLPSLVLVGLALAPREGSLVIKVSQEWRWLIGLGAITGVLTACTRLSTAALVVAVAGLAGLLVPTYRPLLQASPAAPPQGTSDILFITLDTVRADHLDFTGEAAPVAHSPWLSELAARSRVYTECYAAAALTAPSHTTMYSGVSPRVHGVRANGRTIPADLPWVPERLQAAGWSTRAWVSASVLDPAVGFGRGFDAFDATFGEEKRGGETEHFRKPWSTSPRLYRGHGLLSWRGWRLRKGSAFSREGDQTVDGVLAHRPPAGRPSFTWVHLYDAHWPYQPSLEAAQRVGLEDNTPVGNPMLPVLLQQQASQLPPEQLERGRLLYRAGIEDLDRIVGRLIEAAGPDTIIVVAADHGESLGEHGYTFSHGRLPFSPDTRVPLLIAGPGIEPERIDTPVGLGQLAPTLLELAGLPVPIEIALPAGRSLLAPDPAQVVVSSSWAEDFSDPVSDGEDLGPRAGIAVRQGKLTAAVTRWDARGVYDRSADPSELSPVEGGEDTVGIEAILAEALALPVAGGATPEAELQSALEALGYVEPAGERPAAEGPTPPAPTPGAAPR